MPTPKNKEIDKALNVAGWSPEVIAARETLVQKSAVGARSTQASAGRAALKKVAVPLELGLNAVEAARLARSPEVRESRVEEAKDLAKKGMMRRLFAAVDNPVGLVYGAGSLAKETRDTIDDPRLRDQDLAYLKWRAEQDYAASRKAQKAGAQQKSRSAMLRDMARPAAQPK